MTPILRKNYGTETIVPPYRIVKFGAATLSLMLATAPTDKLIGTSGRMGAAVIGDRCEATRMGLDKVTYGGTVAAGDPLTSDATGRAITAAPAAGANVYIIGYAEIPGVINDEGLVLIAPSQMQG